MAEGGGASPGKKRRRGTTASVAETDASPDDAERALGRAVAIGLPAVAAISAVTVGTIASVAPALLVLASGALIGAIALLWASVRTLSGDAPLPTGIEGAVHRGGVDALAEEKLRILLALKDIENEHALGKIEDGDYQMLVARHREDAKRVMREMDLEVEPLREEAERIASAYLAKEAIKHGSDGAHDAGEATPRSPQESADRLECAGCGASNEKDAAFCKKCGRAVATKNGEGDATT